MAHSDISRVDVKTISVNRGFHCAKERDWMQISSDMFHHHLLQSISTSASVGYYEADLSHSATRCVTVVLYHLELSRKVSRTELRISYRDGRSKSGSPLNDVELLGTIGPSTRSRGGREINTLV
jgi:hypothetical protein